MNSMTQAKFKVLGIKKLFLPVKDLGVMGSGGPMRALFGSVRIPSAQGGGQELSTFLRRVQLFEDLDVQGLRRLARLVHERTYRDGEYIFEQGKPGAAMYVLRTGAADILRRTTGGEEMHLATLEPPASLVESVLTPADTVNWFSARARGPVSVVAFGRSDLDALSHNFPLLANRVLVKLAEITALRLQMLVEELTSEQKDAS